MITDKEIQEARDRFAEAYLSSECPLSTENARSLRVFDCKAGFDKGLELGKVFGLMEAFHNADQFKHFSNPKKVFDDLEERARKLLDIPTSKEK